MSFHFIILNMTRRDLELKNYQNNLLATKVIPNPILQRIIQKFFLATNYLATNYVLLIPWKRSSNISRSESGVNGHVTFRRNLGQNHGGVVVVVRRRSSKSKAKERKWRKKKIVFFFLEEEMY